MGKFRIGRATRVALVSVLVVLLSVNSASACRLLQRWRAACYVPTVSCAPAPYCPPACGPAPVVSQPAVADSCCGSEVTYADSYAAPVWDVYSAPVVDTYASPVVDSCCGGEVVGEVISNEYVGESYPVEGTIVDHGVVEGSVVEGSVIGSEVIDGGATSAVEPTPADPMDVPTTEDDAADTSAELDSTPADDPMDDLGFGEDTTSDAAADDGGFGLDDTSADDGLGGDAAADDGGFDLNSGDAAGDDVLGGFDETPAPADDGGFGLDDAAPADDGGFGLDDTSADDGLGGDAAADDSGFDDFIGGDDAADAGAGDGFLDSLDADTPADDGGFEDFLDESTRSEPKRIADTKFVSESSIASNEAEAPVRLWTDNTGRYQTVGKLVRIGDAHIRILKENGHFTTVPKTRLSDADLRYVQQMTDVMGIQTFEVSFTR
ncbi:MAG: hypothetical protein KDA87_11525 [Planctomycetales bacterium]|nr:hypothetical protein [Planctomycetales bacterium]